MDYVLPVTFVQKEKLIPFHALPEHICRILVQHILVVVFVIALCVHRAMFAMLVAQCPLRVQQDTTVRLLWKLINKVYACEITHMDGIRNLNLVLLVHSSHLKGRFMLTVALYAELGSGIFLTLANIAQLSVRPSRLRVPKDIFVKLAVHYLSLALEVHIGRQAAAMVICPAIFVLRPTSVPMLQSIPFHAPAVDSADLDRHMLRSAQEDISVHPIHLSLILVHPDHSAK